MKWGEYAFIVITAMLGAVFIKWVNQEAASGMVTTWFFLLVIIGILNSMNSKS